MESSNNSLEKQKTGKKLIPWHCQIRGNQHSMNHTANKSQCNRQLKSLSLNNKHLAKELERYKCELSESKTVSKSTSHILRLSCNRLKEVSENCKKMAKNLDETYTLIQSCVVNPMSGTNFCSLKRKLNEVARFSSVEEVAENLENELAMENDIILPTDNKAKPEEKKTTPSVKKVKKTTAPKVKKQGLKTKTMSCLPNISIRVPKSYNDDTPPSYLIDSASESFKNMVKQCKKMPNSKTLKKNPKPKQNKVKKIFNRPCPKDPLSDSMNHQEVVEGDKCIGSTTDKVKKLTSSKTSPTNKIDNCDFSKNNCKVSPNNVKTGKNVEKLPIKTKSKVLKKTSLPNVQPDNLGDTSVELDSLNTIVPQPNYALPQVQVLLERKNVMQSDFLPKNKKVSVSQGLTGSKDIHQAALLPNNSKVKTGSSNSAHTDPKDLPQSYSQPSVKNKNSSNPKKSGLCVKDVSDKIEIFNEYTQAASCKSSRANNLKRPLKVNSPNITKKARPSSVSEAEDCKDTNIFVVTAEIHRPPDSYFKDITPCENTVSAIKKNQPTVVLTDIFKSNVNKDNILAKLVNPKLIEKFTQIEDHNGPEMPLDGTASSGEFDAQWNKENKIGAQFCKQKEKPSRRARAKVSSYKEMNLNIKMRR